LYKINIIFYVNESKNPEIYTFHPYTNYPLFKNTIYIRKTDDKYEAMTIIRTRKTNDIYNDEFEIEKIMGHKILDDLKKAIFEVKWSGYDKSENSWVIYDELKYTKNLDENINNLCAKKR
jgi:hypothetical protein